MSPPERDHSPLKRNASKRRLDDDIFTDDEFSRVISSLTNTDDVKEKRQFQDQILESLKLTKESPGDISSVLLPLLQLGYAGLKDTQQSFTTAVRNAVASDQAEDDSTSLRNRLVLFSNPQGRDVLRRLVWCISYDDAETSANAVEAITSVTASFPGTNTYIATRMPVIVLQNFCRTRSTFRLTTLN